MSKIYSNIPPESTPSSSNSTVKYFDDFYNVPIDIDNNSLLQMQAFLQKRGFDKTAAEFTSGIILSQAKADNFNPNQLLDTLSGFSDVQMGGLVAEILNYNRFKTSVLGIYQGPALSDEVQRNILA
jgi:hypothetical protein